MKPWQANLLVFFLELLQLIIYFAIAGSAFKNVTSGNFSGAFNDVRAAIWFLNLSALAISFAIFFVKPLRTRFNVRIAWWNIIWVAGNIYMLYA